MKEVKACIQPWMETRVVHALERIPHFPGLSISEIRGVGTGKGAREPHRISADLKDYTRKLKLETVVPDEMAEAVVTCIIGHGRTGRKGDGKVFVSDVIRAVRVRTGEEDDAALVASAIPEHEPDRGGA